MTTNNEAFEKFAKEKDLAIEQWEDWILANEAWQAATTEANKRIAELTQDRNDLNYLCMERLHKIEELQLSNNRLRESLEKIKGYSSAAGHATYCTIADTELSATPAESLQAFENEVIEKCAKVCESINKYTQFQTVEDYKLVNEAARNIRALKEVK